MPAVNDVQSGQIPQNNTNTSVKKPNNQVKITQKYERNPKSDTFAKHPDTKQKWYKDPFIALLIGIPAAMIIIDGLFMHGKNMKAIFSNKKPLTNEEKKLFEKAKEHLGLSEQKVSHYEKEMRDIKSFMEEQKKKVEEVLKDKNKYKATIGSVTYQKDIMGNYLVTDSSKNGFKFSVRGVLSATKDSIGGEMRLERRSNGKLYDRTQLQNTLSLDKGNVFKRTIYDETGKTVIVEHGNSSAGSIVGEFENGKMVREFEKSKKELFGKRTLKYRDMDGKDKITHSIEKNENEIIIDGKTYDSESLGSKLWKWLEETVIDVI